MIVSRFKEKLVEAIRSVFPVVFIILALSFSMAPQPVAVTLMFLAGCLFVTIGIAAFTLGAEMAMTQLGEALGDYIIGKKKTWFLILMGAITGFIITVAEPGLLVLAEQAGGIPQTVLVLTVAAGVGIFLAVACVRTVSNWPLKYIIWIFYTLLFILAVFVPGDFLPIAFDSGGATTGAMTVPFIMSIGVALARIDKTSDTFGLIAICSIGPIISVMILGLIFTPTGGAETAGFVISQINDTAELFALFVGELPQFMLEVGMSLAPIIILFAILLIFDRKSVKIKKGQGPDVLKGLGFTFGGLALFLTGANVGFLPAGNLLGEALASLDYGWILVPIGMAIGFFMISAEPAVHILNKQVSDATKGGISKRAMGLSLGIGVSLAIGFAMLRVLAHVPIMWILLPGYLIAVGLSVVAPKEFTSIAFDAGGVASGPLTSAFLVPLAIGASASIGGDVTKDAFGLIAMVALTPLITIQLMGLLYEKKKAKTANKALPK